ncbi:unannotated protein [freshwater metagenome]|uniref:Unannotated protein n=1 Tax=freshwater metagenome TaxID=449393 RepID=A0A6J6PN79_9ZZZZ
MITVAVPAVRMAVVLDVVGATFAGLSTLLTPMAGVTTPGIVTVADPAGQLPPVWAFVTANFLVLATVVIVIEEPL